MLVHILPYVKQKYPLILLLLAFRLFPCQSIAQPLAAGQKKFVGNVVSNGFSIRADFPTYWNQVTAENAGKWGNVESSPGVYNWTALDNIYTYAVNNGYPYKHHTLVWGQQQPAFLGSLDSAQQYQEIVNWFVESGNRYLSATFVDVVNEPLHAPPTYAQALGGSGVTGWDWVIRAFELAREHWRFRKLHLNEYSVINDNSANAQFLQIINLLKTRGLIDGIGVQCHRFEIESPSLTTLRNNLNNLAATGLPVYITEFDLGNYGNSGVPNDSVQLALYKQRFPVLWEHPGVKGMTLWGYAQGEMWQTTAYLVRSNTTERPSMVWLRKYLATPLPPLLVAPLGATGVPRNPVLIWQKPPLADSYRIQIATDTFFTSVVADSSTTDTLMQSYPLGSNTKFYWRASASNDSGVSSYSVAGSFTTGDQIVSVEESGGLPAEFALYQNYPNPFNPATVIKYFVPQVSVRQDNILENANLRYISLRVYNPLGQLVATLVDAAQAPGEHRVMWDASIVPGGVYFYRLQAGGFTHVKKMIIIR